MAGLQAMAFGESITVTPFFNWVYLWHTGAAFGLFANGGGWQRYLFIGVVVVVSIALIKFIHNNRHQGETIAYCLVLGGATGNLIDRIFRAMLWITLISIGDPGSGQPSTLPILQLSSVHYFSFP